VGGQIIKMSVVALQKSENIPQYSQCWKTITRVFKDDQKMKIHRTKQKEVNKMKKKMVYSCCE
jgi:hypothetical protein